MNRGAECQVREVGTTRAHARVLTERSRLKRCCGIVWFHRNARSQCAGFSTLSRLFSPAFVLSLSLSAAPSSQLAGASASG